MNRDQRPPESFAVKPMKRGIPEQQEAHAIILAALTAPKSERRERLRAIEPLTTEYLCMCRQEWEARQEVRAHPWRALWRSGVALLRAIVRRC